MPLAVRWFMAQDYANRELIIVDDGPTPIHELIPDEPNIQYIRLNDRHPVGIKRNIACESAQGELIAHWDDDDWFAPHRLSVQVEVMQNRSIDMCGIDTLLYYDLRDGRAWRYIHPRRARHWLSLLMYRRSLWSRTRHCASKMGSDTRFVWRVNPRRIFTLPDTDLNVCMMHSSNVSPKNTQAARWHATAVQDVINVLGDDWRYYKSGIDHSAATDVDFEYSGNLEHASQSKASWQIFILVVGGESGLESLLEELSSASEQHIIDVYILRDAQRQFSLTANRVITGRSWRSDSVSLTGRQACVALFQKVFKLTKSIPEGSHFLVLPEDAKLAPDFFVRAEKYWKQAQNAGALALTLRG